MTQPAVYVVGAVRTAIGSFGGALKDVPLANLATTVVKAAIARSGVAPDQVGHLVMGNVIPTEKIGDLDVIEANEAFAAQACAVANELDLDPAKVNPNGSGISLGHPVGATGAIVTVKALHELQRVNGRYALVTMCIGGGQGIAAIFERV